MIVSLDNGQDNLSVFCHFKDSDDNMTQWNDGSIATGPILQDDPISTLLKGHISLLFIKPMGESEDVLRLENRGTMY